MTTTLQKQLEIAYATKAGELLNASWQVEAAPDEVNWPDLIVRAASGKFGLEVREIYLDETKGGSAKKARESYNRELITELARAYYACSSIPIKVNVLGYIDRQEHLARVLSDEASHLSVFDQIRLEPYDGCVAYVTRLPEQFQNYRWWTYIDDQVGWIASLDKDLLQRVIAQKAKRLVKYRSHISDVRLLIVSNRIYNSGKASLTSEMLCNANGFTSVYYLSYPETVWTITSEQQLTSGTTGR